MEPPRTRGFRGVAPRTSTDDHGSFARSGRHHGLHRGRGRPAQGREAEIGDGGMGDQALTDVDHLVRPVRPKACHPVRPHRELHARPPAQARTGLLVSRQRLDRDLPVEARQPPELLTDHRGLERPLGGQCRVLPVTAAAATGTGVRTRGLNAIRRGRQDLQRFGSGQPGCHVGDTGDNRFARQRVPDKHDRSFVWPGHAPAAVSHVHGRDLDDLTGLIAHHGRGVGTPAFRNADSPPPECQWHSLACSYVPVPAAPVARQRGAASGPLRARPLRAGTSRSSSSPARAGR